MGLMFPKPAPRTKTVKRIRIRPRKSTPLSRIRQALDRAESAKVPERSGGRCEVQEMEMRRVGDELHVFLSRCLCRAEHVMHLIGGNGKRGIGISALADHKLHGCAKHHREIDGDLGGKRLQRIGGVVPHWTDVYERKGTRQEPD